MPKIKQRAFTLKASTGLLKSLIIPVQIIVPEEYNACSAIALWDTGATKSGISDRLAKKLELVPSGELEVDTANGTCIQNTYLVDIVLPNQIIIPNIRATEFTASNDIDALIGMDIITLGDLSITNHNGNTCMSFRIPSCHQLDYSLNEI